MLGHPRGVVVEEMAYALSVHGDKFLPASADNLALWPKNF